MSTRPDSKLEKMRPAIAALALGVFGWGLYRVPGGGSRPALNAEQSRKLQEESAAMRRDGNWAGALAPTLKLHAAYPESHIYPGELAEIYDHLGRYREEAAAWEDYFVRAPRPIEACPRIGEAYQKQGLTKQAIGALERCQQLEPDNPDQIFYLARALERAGQVDRAAALYERGITLSPNYTDLAIGLARVRLRQARFEDARKLADDTLAHAPANADALLVLGLTCQRQGRRSEAKNYLERGLQVAANYADLHLALARIDEQESDLPGAISHYEKAVELDKTNAEAVHRLQLLRSAHP